MIGGQLQRAIFAALTASPAVASGRVYDKVPPDAALPYVTIGDDQVLDDSNSCGDGWEVFSDVHVWSNPDTGSKIEAKDLRATIVDRLTEALTVTGFTVVSAQLDATRTFREPDGLTEHAVITFRHVLTPA